MKGRTGKMSARSLRALEVMLKYVPDMKTSGKKMNWTTAGAASALRTRLTSSPS